MKVTIYLKAEVSEEDIEVSCDDCGVDIGGEWFACERNSKPVVLVPKDNILTVEIVNEEEVSEEEDQAEGHTLQ